MIIECEKCKSKFNIDENLLKEKGSKVRCSRCQNTFTAYPPEPAPVEEPTPDEVLGEDPEETVALDSPPVFEGEEAGPTEELEEVDFDKAFEEAMEDDETVETISPDQIPEQEEEETVDMGEAISRAAKIEDDVKKEDIEKKAEKEPEEAPEAVEVSLPTKKPRRSPLLIILIILLLLVGGAIAIFFLAPGLIPDSLSFLKPSEKQEVTDAGVRNLSFKTVNGSFIQSEKLGQLFVIKGKIANNYSKSRSFILIKGTILDDKGKATKRRMAYAGNTFTENQIKKMSLEEIKKGLKNRFGKKRINLNIKPGAIIPFMVIFEKLPDNMSEFTVEAVSSSPGK